MALSGAPLVVTDLHVRPRDLASLVRVADLLKGTCGSVLVGDHGGARNDFAPSFVAQILIQRGLQPWVTLSCRDRNRVALGSELATLAEIGVVGVHCVTGDWHGSAGSAGETKVFDLDSLRLVELARTYGLRVSVAASPAAAPRELRPARLATKVAAGAQMCFVNHSGGPRTVENFIEASRHAGVEIPFVPCIPVTADRESLAALAALPGTQVDSAAVREAGGQRPTDAIDIAIDASRMMLAVPGVIGVNLSGSASSGSDVESARIMAAIGTGIRLQARKGGSGE